MDPVSIRSERAFAQALRCVRYRLPSQDGFRPQGYLFVLGVRYGFIGLAAGHHLLTTSRVHEEPWLLRSIESWPDLVEDYVRCELPHHLPLGAPANAAHVVGRISYLPIRSYLPLYRRLCPISRALELISGALVAENKGLITEGWPWFRRKSAVRAAGSSLEESTSFALNFFERRQSDLEEVPEIALIGE